MWNRFNESGRAVILQAQQIANATKSSQVNDLHLLTALAKFENGVGRAVLQQQLDVDKLVIRSQTIVSMLTPEPTSDDIPRLTNTGKRVLEVAADESRRLSHKHIGTEHLLLALTRVDSPAKQLLLEYGLNTDKCRESTITFLTGVVDKSFSSPLDLTQENDTEEIVAPELKPSTMSSGDLLEELTNRFAEQDRLRSILHEYALTNETPEDTLKRVLDSLALQHQTLLKVAEYRHARGQQSDSQFEQWLLVCKQLDEMQIIHSDQQEN